MPPSSLHSLLSTLCTYLPLMKLAFPSLFCFFASLTKQLMLSFRFGLYLPGTLLRISYHIYFISLYFKDRGSCSLKVDWCNEKFLINQWKCHNYHQRWFAGIKELRTCLFEVAVCSFQGWGNPGSCVSCGLVQLQLFLQVLRQWAGLCFPREREEHPILSHCGCH